MPVVTTFIVVTKAMLLRGRKSGNLPQNTDPNPRRELYLFQRRAPGKGLANFHAERFQLLFRITNVLLWQSNRERVHLSM